MNKTIFKNSLCSLLFSFIILFPSISFAATQSCGNESTAARLTCEFGDFIQLAVIIGYFLAALLFFLGGFYIYLMNKKPGQYGAGVVVACFLSATFFAGFSNVITLYQSVLFGSSDLYTINQYSSMVQQIKGVGAGQMGYVSSSTMQALVGFVKLIGVIAILRSIYLIYVFGKSGGREAGGGSIIVFGIGGAIAFRIEDFSCMLADLFNITSICLL